ncbi:SseB family protein [Streptomonospora nanhaiensis]|uniref:SseB family protein n=1 Tax=Streptomonospora nanhaiensis TaxID=1323731 RepID=UPI001C9969B2|nr:SseB family protein [Streptomonospora nanhaiensis]MBX9389346.1 SseB family protein [Streptomonospora nanhaiensis]
MSTGNENPAPAAQPAFPANEVESALQRALEHSRAAEGDSGPVDPAPITDFLAALREAQVWIPLPQGSGTQEDGSVALPTLEVERAPFIPVFTSMEQLGARSGDLPYTVLAARELAGAMPEGVGLALNPGNEASVPLYPATVAVLAR